MTLSAEVDKKTKYDKVRLVFIILLLLFSIFFIINTRTSYFNIKEIIVNNNSLINDNKIILSSGISEGINIFDIKLDVASYNIKQHPYIKNVKIKRKLPDKIIIDISERKVKLVINIMDTDILVDNNGIILNVVSHKEIRDIPIVKGLKIRNITIGNNVLIEDELNLATILNFIEVLDSYEVLRDIDIIDFTDSNNVILINNSETNFLIGNLEEIEYKINLISEIMSNLKKQEVLGGTVFINTEGNSYYSPKGI